MRLVLGTAQFGLPYGVANHSGQVSLREAELMLSLGLINGVDTLDTAISYGSSEECLGKVGNGKFKIVTKLPACPDGCNVSEWVYQQVEESLSRLQVNSLYGLLLHRPEQLLGANGYELYKCLESIKKKGQVKNIGASIYSPNELDNIIPYFDMDIIQAPFSLIDRRLLNTGWLNRLKENGVEIHTRSTFLQGLLLMKEGAHPSQFSRWSRLFEEWHQWLISANMSPLHTCLAYPLSFPQVDRVVIGAQTAAQLDQIIKCSHIPFHGGFPDIHSDDENLINPSTWRNERSV